MSREDLIKAMAAVVKSKLFEATDRADEVTFVEIASALLTAIEQSGMTIVPVEATKDMLAACWPLYHPWGKGAPPPEDRPNAFADMQEKRSADYRAMLEAGRLK